MKALSARDPEGEDDPLVDPTLTERQFWRISVALEACGAAWRELEGHLMDPNNSTTILLQELASTREIMTASALQSVRPTPTKPLPTAQHILTSLLPRLVPTFLTTNSATASSPPSRPTPGTTTAL